VGGTVDFLSTLAVQSLALWTLWTGTTGSPMAGRRYCASCVGGSKMQV
jgi:hypothetical protein